MPIVGDLKNVLVELNRKVEKLNHLSWIEQINEWKENTLCPIGKQKEI